MSQCKLIIPPNVGKLTIEDRELWDEWDDFFDESDSEDEEEKKQDQFSIIFSSDEEGTKRAVRSTKSRRYKKLMNIIKKIQNYKQIKDMSSMLSNFEDLIHAYTKTLPIIVKEENGKTPRFYLRCLVELEDFINEMCKNRKGRKNISKNSKSLTLMRRKLSRYNKEFEEDITKFRENPDQPDEEEEKPEIEIKSREELLADSEVYRSDSESISTPIPTSKGDADSERYWGSVSDSESDSSVDYRSKRIRLTSLKAFQKRIRNGYKRRPRCS